MISEQIATQSSQMYAPSACDQLAYLVFCLSAERAADLGIIPFIAIVFFLSTYYN